MFQLNFPRRFLIVAIALFCLSCVGSTARASNADLLANLVKRANAGGKLLAAMQGSWGPALEPQLADAFKKRFGLTIDVSITPVQSGKNIPLEIAATRAGAPPNYDVVQGDGAPMTQLIGAKGAESIPHWRKLLAVVNPLVASHKVSPGQISSGPFEGLTFLYSGNVKQLVYNTGMIKLSELPKTHPELADQKYKGKFTQPPWTSHWELSPQLLTERAPDRDKWLDVVRAAGSNTGAILTESQGVQRVVLGQYAFTLGQDAEVRIALQHDPHAAIAYTYFHDYNELNTVYYAVRTGARNPAAAALFALWMTSPESEAIWQPSMQTFVPYGFSKIDVAERQAIKASGAKVIGFFDNPETVALLRWEQSSDGTRYLGDMMKAILGQ